MKVFYKNKKNIKNYFEIYLKVPNNEFMKRDPKEIYKNFKKGIISETEIRGSEIIKTFILFGEVL